MSAAGPIQLLVVDDDPITCKRLEAYFTKEGYAVHIAHDGPGMWSVLGRHPISVLLLDVGLPGKDGLALARELRVRDEQIGIILVSGHDDDVDKIVGLESGADDYVTKPFNARELLARVKIVLRSARKGPGPVPDALLTLGRWTFDVGQRRLCNAQGEQEVLTRGEMDLLAALAGKPGVVMSRERLMQHVSHRAWDPGDRTIDVLVSRLRDKLEDDPRKPRLIVTVRSEGYVLANASGRS